MNGASPCVYRLGDLYLALVKRLFIHQDSTAALPGILLYNTFQDFFFLFSLFGSNCGARSVAFKVHVYRKHLPGRRHLHTKQVGEAEEYFAVEIVVRGDIYFVMSYFFYNDAGEQVGKCFSCSSSCWITSFMASPSGEGCLPLR